MGPPTLGQERSALRGVGGRLGRALFWQASLRYTPFGSAGPLLLMAGLGSSCASHEPGRYQIARLTLEGQEHLAERPALACLISRERPRFSLTLGLGEPTCGEPPFDSQAPRLALWRWWWTDWPPLNRAVFDEDLERIVRWYRARGYYDAKITNVSFDPPQAEDPAASPPCDLEHEICRVRIQVTIDEGEATLVRDVTFAGLEDLPNALKSELRILGALERGAPIDEADYDQAKKRMRERLRQAGHADPTVEGRVDVETVSHRAHVAFELTPGPIYRFGDLTLEGNGRLPARPIIAAAALPTGKQYHPDDLEELQAEVYALGAFSSVEVHEELDEKNARVDVRLDVAPRAPHDLRLGVGVLSGAQQRTSTGELTSIPQWDIHLFGRYERRHVFGTLGRFSIEDRPRMIFSEDFPRTTPPSFGNQIWIRMNQPGLVEKRTDLFTENAWDYGPDPFLGFLRSDIYFRVGLRRGFFARKLLATLAVQQDLYLVNSSPDNTTSDGSELPSTYGYTYLEEDLRLDFRDDPVRPYLGTYFALNATQAPRWRGSDWTAYRFAPEARAFLPLFWDIVWASRFAIAGFFITSADPALDATSEQLGPNTYRLRGGGANSNRGFLAGQLGVGAQGGIRRWEASSELRVPLGKSFVIAGFVDVGDVNDQPYWRFTHLHFTAGFGLRFYTILGAIRLDTGLRVEPWQRTDGSNAIDPEDSKLFGAPGALHLTIGDAF